MRVGAELPRTETFKVIKRQLWSGLIDGLDEVSADAGRRMLQMTEGPDFAEGAAALREKRPPRFGRK